MNKFFYPLILLLFIASFPVFKHWQAAKKFNWPPNHYLVVNCNIYDSHGEILRETPLMGCHFFEDGRIFGKKEDTVMMYDRFGKIIWKKNIRGHHISNFIQSKSRIIFLSSETKKYINHLVLFDVVHIIDFNGNILNSWHVFDHIEELSKRFNVPEGFLWDQKPPMMNANKQFSHANSIYEVPLNDLSKTDPAFAEGNFIISLHGAIGGFVILSHDLKNILWSPRKKYNVHDVQVLPNGRILIFRNRDGERQRTTIEEIDPLTEEKKWTYYSDNPTEFYSSVGGSVQKLSDLHYLIGSNGKNTKVRIISEDNKTLWEKNLTYKNGPKYHIERVQILDLGSFLKSNTL